MNQIPHDKNIDSTLTLTFDVYEFISKRYDWQDSDILLSRILAIPESRFVINNVRIR